MLRPILRGSRMTAKQLDIINQYIALDDQISPLVSIYLNSEEKEDSDAALKAWMDIEKQKKEFRKAHDEAVYYEYFYNMWNHEYSYTRDIEDVLLNSPRDLQDIEINQKHLDQFRAAHEDFLKPLNGWITKTGKIVISEDGFEALKELLEEMDPEEYYNLAGLFDLNQEIIRMEDIDLMFSSVSEFLKHEIAKDFCYYEDFLKYDGRISSFSKEDIFDHIEIDDVIENITGFIKKNDKFPETGNEDLNEFFNSFWKD